MDGHKYAKDITNDLEALLRSNPIVDIKSAVEWLGLTRDVHNAVKVIAIEAMKVVNEGHTS